MSDQPMSKDGDECPVCDRTDAHNHGYENDEAAHDIEQLALCVGALEGMSERGRKAAMNYLISRYDR